MFKFLLLSLLSIPAFASSYTCLNTGADPSAIQSLLTAGGTVSITGPTCAMGSVDINVPGSTTVQASGTVTLNSSHSGAQWKLNGDSITVNGFIFNGSGLTTTVNSTSTPQSNLTITGNTFENISNGSDAISSSGFWNNVTITGNTFSNISTVPIGSVTPSITVDPGYGACTYPAGCAGLGITNGRGINQTKIENNSFDYCFGDCIHISYDWAQSSGTTYHAVDGNSISYNTFIRSHRMGIETQGVASASNCVPANTGCVFSPRPTNLKIAGNYYHQPVAPYGNTYGYSFPVGATSPLMINNTGSVQVTGSNGATGYCMESGNQDEVNQGNVCSVNTSVTTPFGTYDSSGYPGTGHVVTFQNNYFAGATGAGGYYKPEGTNFGGTFVNQYNVNNSTCDIGTGCDTSNISTGSSAITPSGTSATLNSYATGQLSIRNVQFKLNGAVVATQELGDLNNNFSSDRKWLYSHTFSGLANGSHTVQAVATDVSGATNSTSQSFSIGSTEVNNINFPFVSHGSFSVAWTSLTDSTNDRIRYNTSSCSAGTGGNVQTNFLGFIKASYARLAIGGLAPSTTYFVCPEVSKDGGATWSTGAEATVTTAALPAIHPAPPIAPLDFNSDYPNTASYFTAHVNSACSNTDFGNAYSDAVTRWSTQGTIIAVAAGGICGGGPYAFSGTPPDNHAWLPADLTLPSTLTWTGHGFTEGDLVSFGISYVASTPATTLPVSTSCDVGVGSIAPGGIEVGQRYQVHKIDNDHFQVYCLPATPVDPSLPPVTPPIMVFTTTGVVGAAQTFEALPFMNTGTAKNPIWQRRMSSGPLNGQPTPWIIIRPDVPDSRIPPEHSQITPAWLPSMFSFVDPLANITNVNTTHPFIIFGDPDANAQKLFGNIRIMGARITTQDYATSVHSSDPWFWNNLWVSYPWSSQVICDRCYYHILDTPNREQIGMRWDGSNMGFIDSYLDDMAYFHAANTGLTLLQVDATHFTIAPGTAYAGVATVPLASTATVTISGSGSGRVRAYFDLLNSNALTIAVPAGLTASCSGATCVSAVSSGALSGACSPTFSTTTTENASDGWPKTANGEVTVAQIGCADVTSGSITTAGSANPGISLWNNETDSHMLGGTGPGPYKFVNNYSDGAGLTWHFDDGGNFRWRGNYIWDRNYIKQNLRYMHGSSTSDGLFYFERQPLEWKGGQIIRAKGNIFDGVWREDIPNSAFFAIQPLRGGQVTDVLFESNTLMHGSAMLQGPTNTCGGGGGDPCSGPSIRVRYDNILTLDIDGYKYAAFNPNGNSGPGLGWGNQIQGMEDFVLDHLTNTPNRGTTPWILSMSQQALEGYQYTDSIIWLSGLLTQTNTAFGDGSGGTDTPPGCTGLISAPFMNCSFTQGISNPLYDFNRDLIPGGYVDTSVPSGQVSLARINTAFAGLGITPLSPGTVAGTITAINWANPTLDINANYCLSTGSPYVAGGASAISRNADVGVDCIKLMKDQGYLAPPTVPTASVTTTGFQVAYLAPDSASCSVDVSLSTDPNGITPLQRTSDGGGSTSRTVTFTGLTTKTAYVAWVRCQGNAVMSQKSVLVNTK